jgi:multidrug efflux system outer membrane protein
MKQGIFLLILVLLTMSIAAEPMILTLDDVINRAATESNDLQQTLIDIQTAQIQAKNNWSQFLPGINAGAGLNYRNNLFTENTSPTNQDPLSFSTQLNFRLDLNGGIPYQMKNNTLAYQSQLLNYENIRRQLEAAAAKTFYNLIAEKENLSILEDVLNLSQQQYRKDQVSFQNGLINQLTMVRSQLSAESSKLELVQAQSQYEINKNAFLMILGFDQNSDVTFEDGFDIFQLTENPETLIAEHLYKRPDIANQRNRIEMLENTKKQTAINAKAPSISLSAGWSGGWSGNFSDSISGGVSVGIPIDSWIPGSDADQRIKSASGESEKARLELHNIENNAADQIRSLTANLNNSWESIIVSQRKIEIAELTYSLTEQGFQNGTVEFIDLETARQELFQARQDLLIEETTYKNMIFDLAAALNINWQELMRSDL